MSAICELQINPDGAALVYTNLTDAELQIPASITDITAVNDEGVVAVAQAEKTVILVGSDNTEFTGTLVSVVVNGDRTDVVTEIDGQRVTHCNVVRYAVPAEPKWAVAETAKTTVFAKTRQIDWTPKFVLTIDPTTGRVKQLALLAVVRSSLSPLTVAKVTLRTKPAGRARDDTSSAAYPMAAAYTRIDTVMNRGEYLVEECSLELQSASCEKSSRRAQPATVQVIEREANGELVFHIDDKPTTITSQLQTQLWKLTDSIDQTFSYDTGSDTVQYGYTFIVKPSQTPNNAQIDVYTTDNKCLLTNGRVSITGDKMSVRIGESDRFRVKKTVTPASFMKSGSTTITVTSAGSSNVVLAVNHYDRDTKLRKTKDMVLTPGLNVLDIAGM